MVVALLVRAAPAPEGIGGAVFDDFGFAGREQGATVDLDLGELCPGP